MFFYFAVIIKDFVKNYKITVTIACPQASIVNGIKLIGDCLVCAVVNNVAISVSGIRIFSL